MAWPSILAHVGALTGGVAASAWILRRSSDALLRLTAGLVAIFAPDKRSRADRALDVLRTVRSTNSDESSRRTDQELDRGKTDTCPVQQKTTATLPTGIDLMRPE